MFRKLHIQMTVFSAAITSTILIVMALVCLLIAESSAKENSYATFVNNAGACITQMEEQPAISHRWLKTMMNNYHVRILIRDNGNPLYFYKLADFGQDSSAFSRALDLSRDSYGLNLESYSRNQKLTKSADFQFPGYYACTALVPHTDGVLSIIILYPLSDLHLQLNTQRLAFGGAVLAAIAAVSVFSWFFTKKMIRPLEKSRKEQTAFIAAASHELRSPLAVIRSGLSAIPRATPERAGVFVDMSLKECDRMARLIQDMLSLSNADNHTWRLEAAPCELDTLLLETYEKYEPLTKEKGLRLTVSLPDAPLDPLSLDTGKISQVLAVLLDNAISYVPEGGRICLSLKKEPGAAVVSVADNGPGIPDSEKESIFQRFYRSDTSRNDKQHFGLGLCIAREIAVLHKGTLTVSDAPEGGAVFSLYLPYT
ncbi:MAG TPA: HAMP domain-containing histidine kinase [Candidatus Blautia intestinipullorum]|nr:HAMP domain-containing histidine kinase [Candidatus Blautia intestinipullorum]